MTRTCLGLLICLAFFSFTAESANGASEMDKNNLEELFAKNNPVEKFKQRVDFDQVVSREDQSTRVSANWAQLGLAPVAQGLHVSGPVVSVSTLAYDKDQTRVQWVLSDGTNMATVNAIDALTPVGARKRFMDNAEGNSMMDIPYVKGPVNLGTVSAISRDSGSGPMRLFWIYRNMYFEVNIRGKVDQLALARFIQEHAEKNLQSITASDRLQ